MYYVSSECLDSSGRVKASRGVIVYVWNFELLVLITQYFISTIIMCDIIMCGIINLWG